eukprot:9559220-Alexandrium_andersonii.AAC.1
MAGPFQPTCCARMQKRGTPRTLSARPSQASPNPLARKPAPRPEAAEDGLSPTKKQEPRNLQAPPVKLA